MEDVTHYGYSSAAEGVCTATDGQRRTTVRMVTCRYCANLIDLFLHVRSRQFLSAPAMRIDTSPTRSPVTGGEG